MYKILSRILIHILNKIETPEKVRTLTNEQRIGMLALMWQNPMIRTYLEERERFLIDSGMDAFIAGKLSNSSMWAGRLQEVRELRLRIRMAYTSLTEERKRKQERALDKKMNNS